MIENTTRLQKTLRQIGRLLFLIVVGIIGGMVCGALILSLCGLSGRSQTSGAEYVGYWSIGLVLLGAMYGGPLGAILGPIGYVTVVRTTGFRRAFLPSALGTVIGGFAGSLYTPIFGVPGGVVGFFVALLAVRNIRPTRPQPNLMSGTDHV